MSGHTYTHTHIHTHTHDNYYNPRCAHAHRGLIVGVNSRSAAYKPINIKFAEDIWTITNCLQHKGIIPRSLLGNGKGDRGSFEMQTPWSAGATLPRVLSDEILNNAYLKEMAVTCFA